MQRSYATIENTKTQHNEMILIVYGAVVSCAEVYACQVKSKEFMSFAGSTSIAWKARIPARECRSGTSCI